MNSDLAASALHSTCRGGAEVNCAVTEQIRLWLASSGDTDVTSQTVVSIFMQRQEGLSPAIRRQMATKSAIWLTNLKLRFSAMNGFVARRESECCIEVWRHLPAITVI